ncbi:MAG: TIGR02147 family protein [Deltaproteobacteria bacterium]|nr:TIGR02147 family protein [Deltaproteobacteria bacterium]
METTTQKSRINIFEYLDYREFLRDWYKSHKSGRSTVSLRSFSKKAGFTSSNILKLVMDGNRNLTAESAAQFAIGLGLNKQETAFFLNLVFYNQGKSVEEKDSHYKKLVQSKKFSELKSVEKDQYDYYSTWYHPVVRELMTSNEFDGTPEWIMSQIRPEITVIQAKKSMELLERLGFVKKTPKNQWVQSNPLLTTGPESSSHIILRYHQSLLEIIRSLLVQIEPEDRDVGALTLGVSKKMFPEIKKKVQEFRREILKMVSTENNPEVVISLSTQLIPLVKKGEE